MTASLKKKADENENQYLWRIGNLIDDGKIKNWESVLSIVNTELFGDDESHYKGESAYRKKYAAARDFYTDVFIRLNEDKSAKDLERKLKDLQNERYKIAAEKVEYTRFNRQRSRIELFNENIAREIQRFPTYMWFSSAEYKPKDNKEYVLTLSDIHYGAKFATENNFYDTNECARRFENLLKHMRTIIKERELTKIKVVNLGDEVQGILRMTDLQLNETSVVKAVVEVSKLISSFLYELCTMSCHVEYYSVPRSNHTQTRPLGSKASELVAEDLIYIINNMIKVSLENTDVAIFTGGDSDYIEVPVWNFHVIATHGHGIKNLGTYLQQISSYKREFIDYALVGHFHRFEVAPGTCAAFHDTEVVVAPSFIGSDPYAETLLKCSKPACLLLGFDKEKGLIETNKIIID